MMILLREILKCSYSDLEILLRHICFKKDRTEYFSIVSVSAFSRLCFCILCEYLNKSIQKNVQREHSWLIVEYICIKYYTFIRCAGGLLNFTSVIKI